MQFHGINTFMTLCSNSTAHSAGLILWALLIRQWLSTLLASLSPLLHNVSMILSLLNTTFKWESFSVSRSLLGSFPHSSVSLGFIRVVAGSQKAPQLQGWMTYLYQFIQLLLDERPILLIMVILLEGRGDVSVLCTSTVMLTMCLVCIHVW